MLVNFIQFPPVHAGRDAEFREWFRWSNEEYSRFPGFISRRLLVARDGGAPYAAIVEHESYETFVAMHTSDVQKQAAERVRPLLDGSPAPHFYDTADEMVGSTR